MHFIYVYLMQLTHAPKSLITLIVLDTYVSVSYHHKMPFNKPSLNLTAYNSHELFLISVSAVAQKTR